jgi:hypothetical protein
MAYMPAPPRKVQIRLDLLPAFINSVYVLNSGMNNPDWNHQRYPADLI